MMEIGILILIILGAFIFKKGKSNEESPQKPVPSKDMTWEEMEEYYGITLSRNPEEPVKEQSDIATENTSEGSAIMGNPVDVDSSNLGISRKNSLQLAARRGMVWSMILEPPKGARMVSRFRR